MKKFPQFNNYVINPKTGMAFTPREKAETASERIAKAKQAVASAKMTLVGPQRPNPPKPYRSPYDTVTWAGKTYKIRRPFE